MDGEKTDCGQIGVLRELCSESDEVTIHGVDDDSRRTRQDSSVNRHLIREPSVRDGSRNQCSAESALERSQRVNCTVRPERVGAARKGPADAVASPSNGATRTRRHSP